MDENVRHCALPGCDVLLDDLPGCPTRRYCTAAHRVVARQARRAAMRPDLPVRFAETLPWLREPEPEPGPARPVRAQSARAATASPPARCSGAVQLGERRSRRGRAIAVFGAAGLLAGGYEAPAQLYPNITDPVEVTPQGESSDSWAARAQVTLTSITRQLDTIAATEAAWNAAPEHSAVGAPVPVAELRNRKALLEQREAALRSQLDSYRALAGTRADLELAEQHLDAVEQALGTTPAAGAVSSPEEASTLAVLQEQRDLRLRQRDAKKLELARIEGSVEKAVSTPLPDDGQQTTAVSDRVLEVIRTGEGRPPTAPEPGPARPQVLAGGRDGAQDEERPASTTSAPPDPRGPRAESARRHDGPRPDAAPRSPAPKGPVGKVVETVEGALGGGEQEPRPADPSSSDHERSDAPEPRQQVEEPVRKVADTLDGTIDGAVGRVPGVPVPDTAARPAADGGAWRDRSAPVVAPVPTGGGPSGSMPGAELAMAIVGSVPGGEVAAPAVQAAMSQVGAQVGAQGGAPYADPTSGSAASGSGVASTQLTTAVADSGGPANPWKSGAWGPAGTDWAD